MFQHIEIRPVPIRIVHFAQVTGLHELTLSLHGRIWVSSAVEEQIHLAHRVRGCSGHEMARYDESEICRGDVELRAELYGLQPHVAGCIYRIELEPGCWVMEEQLTSTLVIAGRIVASPARSAILLITDIPRLYDGSDVEIVGLD